MKSRLTRLADASSTERQISDEKNKVVQCGHLTSQPITLLQVLSTSHVTVKAAPAAS